MTKVIRKTNMKTFVWSDNHWRHLNISGPTLSKWKEGYRHFSSLEEMEDLMVENANKVVGSDDEIIFNGDVIMGFQPEIHLPRIKERFICKNWRLNWGNHDVKLRKREDMRSLFMDHLERRRLYVNKTLVVMDHYPISSWEDMADGSVHLFGHTHTSYFHYGRSLNICVENTNYTPLDIEWCVQECLKKEVVKIDHHGE